MRHGSLFSGIGGFDLAAQWMGWENVFQVEWDRWCQKVLAKNFPDALRFGDIVEFNNKLENGEIITNTFSDGCEDRYTKARRTERQGEQRGVCEFERSGTQSINIGHIDIITGGFPCQPFSHAGKRKGVADERYLWPEMLRTIRILKPSFVVGENVAGLVSMDNGKTLDAILFDLEDEGYQVESFIIPACAIGAWHRRDRIWIVANRKSQFSSTDTFRKSCGQKQRKFRGMGSETDVSQGIDSIDTRDCVITNPFCGGQPRQGESFDAINTKEAEIRQTTEPGNGCTPDQWSTEPSVGRVANGIPNRVDRLKGLGNAIVPQIALQLFKAIAEYKNI
jgi:DNA (cytosine-5)-methyltransferase 1